MLLRGGHRWYGRTSGCRFQGSGGRLGVGRNLAVHTKVFHRRRLHIPPGSPVVQVLYLSEQVGVSPLPLHEFLRFAEQVCDPLCRDWVYALVFALTKSCLCRPGDRLSGEHRFRCARAPLFSPSSPWRWCHRCWGWHCSWWRRRWGFSQLLECRTMVKHPLYPLPSYHRRYGRNGVRFVCLSIRTADVEVST